MTYQELQTWIAYRESMGPFDIRLRNDRALAVLATRLAGGKMVDYMPWPKPPDIVQKEKGMPEADTAQMIAYLGGEKASKGILGRTGRKWRAQKV